MGLWERAEFIKTMRVVKFLSDHPPSCGKPMCYVELQAPLMRTKSEAKGRGGGQNCAFPHLDGHPWLRLQLDGVALVTQTSPGTLCSLPFPRHL